MLIQRIGAETQSDSEFINTFIEKIQNCKDCCDEVWLSGEYGYPKLEVHKTKVQNLIKIAEKFKQAGIDVSLQISNTIGHGEYMSCKDNSGLIYDGSPAEKMVGPDGTIAEYCFCWNGEYFRQYIIAAIQVYAKIKPRVVWFDDDLRPENHYPVDFGCFCDNCIDRFNQKYSGTFSRGELVKEIHCGNLVWRKRWIEFQQKGLFEFTYSVAKAFHDISPDSYMGYQHGHYGCYTGQGFNYIFKALKDASEKNPKSRPGGGVYNGHNPNDFLRKMMLISWQNYTLPDYVTDTLPEIENLPNVIYGKSIAGCCFETSLYFAAGSTGMTYAMAQNYLESLDWHGEMLSAFSNHRKYWDVLKCYNQDTMQAGLSLVSPKETWSIDTTCEQEAFSWTMEPVLAGTELLGLGIPLCYGGNKDSVRLLPFACAERLSKQEIEELLLQPVITDGETLEYLTHYGYNFSAEAKKIYTQNLREIFSDHVINGDKAGAYWSQGFYFREGYELFDKTGETEVFGYYESNALNLKRREGKYPFGIANAVIKTSKGAFWIVFGYGIWTNVVSSAKRNQIIKAADYISEKRLPAYVESPYQTVILPRENKEGRVTSISIVNNTIGESGALKIKIRHPAEINFIFMSQDGQEIELGFVADREEYTVEIPSLSPWTIGTIFCKKD